MRRHYIANEPIQPHNPKFPQKIIGRRLRRFHSSWFVNYGIWLEYSIHKDAAFCLYCYLLLMSEKIKIGILLGRDFQHGINLTHSRLTVAILTLFITKF